ncbi:nuclear intron maturase 4, mitochondrial isoform X1 [Capsicum galapagoense]
MVVHKCTSLLHFLPRYSSSFIGRPVAGFLGYSLYYSTANQFDCHTHDENIGKLKLAQGLAGLVHKSLNLEEKKSLASTKLVEKSIEDLGRVKHGASLARDLANLVEESYNLDETKPMDRVEHKRLLELRIKKRVKEQCVNGKFQNLLKKVIANPKTLSDAFDCIRLSCNVDLVLDGENLPFEALAEELSCGYFDVSANTYSISTKGSKKQVLVFPNVKLKIVEEAIRIVFEVVYRPHFSKISHGCRSGRSHLSALKYVCKEIINPNWWFTLPVSKKLDNQILAKLFSIMEDKIDDPFLYAIISNMFDCGVLNLEFGGFPKGHGLPQEGALSPILMNIYLDLFDHEMYRLSMRYEAIDNRSSAEKGAGNSVLRSWFRRQISGNGSQECHDLSYSEIRVHCCRFMDEILIAISGPKDVAVAVKSKTEIYLKNSLHLEFENEINVFPCDGPTGIRFLGSVVKRSLKESPAVKAVHKLKEKVKLFASQKEHSWDTGTARIGKKWLGHGLKKVKESEIKHLSDGSSLLSQISCFRKDGMETDHWYKVLLKVWMQNKNVKCATNEDVILSKHIVEPSLPQDLRDSYYEFQKRAQEYISSETASTLALLPNSNSSSLATQIIAPISIIKKRLFRYGLTNSQGYPRPCHLLVFWDDNEIVDWYAGLIYRWLRWYAECDNFNEVKLIICNQVRLSCIRTLATKYRIHETEIEKKFDFELRRIPATEDTEIEITNEATNCEAVDNDALMYGITYSGICLFSLARMVSQSRPCNCFVIGCSAAAPRVYTLHVMERQRFPSWKTGFSSCIHPSLHRRRLGLCKHHLKDLLLGYISLQSINFGAWKGNNFP